MMEYPGMPAPSHYTAHLSLLKCFASFSHLPLTGQFQENVEQGGKRFFLLILEGEERSELGRDLPEVM